MKNRNHFNPRNKGNSGFTLIEAIVSITIFIVVMIVAATALLSIINANRESHEIKTVMDNLNFALDDMVRSIRVGDNYGCNGVTGANSSSPGSPPLACSSFSFSSPYDGGDTIKYALSSTPTSSTVCPTGGSQMTKQDITLAGTPQTLTDPQVCVAGLNFYVLGAAAGPTDGQPQVIITVYGYAAQGRDRAGFNVQTSVTQRLYDE